ncbi:hypothetical protein G6F46_011853 [Rhizopus delemar]|uniref:White collar 2 protein n=2 Tax=Rhizopus TaxID=4842 RepID=A0A9P7CMP1_9FUNG|nr:hypothetical protein G6F55_012867 [Rhizopus delemar]KAG1532930.1 hypothetical protein G6F51_012869 [Rhizopus arrhizus]KAG1492820.1 hypothetical protein G6F54_009025 [Rhizopus delemar]KAG1493659.1 hypothetical protein G6F53_012715 [Rhizopus delemar]KAG1503595.1 hypothetical protein G6F52_012262 [Rhizopus delemar]
MDTGQVIEINNFASHTLSTRPTQSSAPSAVPEFTKRKNWSQNILEALRDVLHVLSPDLTVLYCSSASREFLGYQPADLIGRKFTEFLHKDDVDLFTRAFRASQASESILRTTYRFLRKDGKYASLETRGHFFKTGFFGSARSVPAETTRTMDTFLDFKMENEILKRKIQAARAASGHQTKKKSGQELSREIPESIAVDGQVEEYDDFEEDFEQLFAAVSNPNVYTQGVLNSFGAAESVKLFTGLNFDLGERSRGISMGLEGELFNTLVPPEIGAEASNETDKLKVGKKRRGEDDEPRICTDCGRTDAPEWRKGPRGPKTLCNACGLRWAKANKS